MRRTIIASALLVPVSVLLSSEMFSAPRQPNAQATAPAPSGATAAWTLKVKGDIRWQQVTPVGALLVSTDTALAAVDTERGQVMWEKPELGGLQADGVRMVEGSLPMETARPGLRSLRSTISRQANSVGRTKRSSSRPSPRRGASVP